MGKLKLLIFLSDIKRLPALLFYKNPILSSTAGSNKSLEGNFSLAATWDIISILRNKHPPTKKKKKKLAKSNGGIYLLVKTSDWQSPYVTLFQKVPALLNNGILIILCVQCSPWANSVCQFLFQYLSSINW